MSYRKPLLGTLAALAAISTPVFAQSKPTLDTYLPEPMVFDLVRPLGARKGELEVNSLFQSRLAGKHRRLEWAPELEWAFANGYSFELELPLENQNLVSYKWALQGTLGAKSPRRFIHGWQVIGRYDLQERTLPLDMLYLAGGHLSERWSVFTMSGVRYPQANRGGGRPVGLFNPSLFYKASPRLLWGLEVNTELENKRTGSVLIMPQAQLQLSPEYSLQVGVGARKEAPRAPFYGTIGMRFVRQL